MMPLGSLLRRVTSTASDDIEPAIRAEIAADETIMMRAARLEAESFIAECVDQIAVGAFGAGQAIELMALKLGKYYHKGAIDALDRRRVGR